MPPPESGLAAPGAEVAERLDAVFEARLAALRARGRASAAAIEAEDGALSFEGLDRLANQLARDYLDWGLEPGMRVGLLLDKSHVTYAALLAAVKLGLTFVPVDASYPLDRLRYIAEDAGIASFIVSPRYANRLAGLGVGVLELTADHVREARQRPDGRLTEGETAGAARDLAYIVYTSGSTGTPKGVAIGHASFCNFVRVAGEVYGVVEGDRVYQGMTLAFDFSTEELWVPLIAGATIVPGPSDVTLVGRELGRFLGQKRITALCCVPTLLQSLPEDLPDLRFLLVSGEACPQDLVTRWHRPGRRMLNAYGPTEATVTASWTELDPGRPVTIGKPLPTYTMVILGPDGHSLAEPGSPGEIAIGGIGLARGYVNRPEQTARAFIDDFLDLADNPSGKLYRTGDLGRFNAEGEIEYLGRIDTQVKVRGYRIELTEIESAILEVPGVAQAVARIYAPEGGGVELAAFFTRRPGSSPVEPREIVEHLRTRLPGYMIPAFIEDVAAIPLLSSNKADRGQLPEPSTPRLVTGRGDPVAPRSATEGVIAQALAKVLGVHEVSVTDDFFADLGGQSLLMTEFVFILQDRLAGRAPSIRDVYQHPTVERLARAVERAQENGGGSSDTPAGTPKGPRVAASPAEHALCAVLQYAFYAAMALLYAALGLESYARVASALNMADLYLGALAASAQVITITAALPIVAKWLLIGRWRAGQIRIWSLDYYRFWVVKQLVQTSPLTLLRGTPIYNLYLRLLGARIGPGAVLNLRFTPVCTDLLTVGARAVVAKDAVAQTYRAERGMILTGPVSIGADAYVGESSVLDVGTGVGVMGELAHASSLYRGQTVPPGQSFWGSPAVPCPHRSMPPVARRKASRARRIVYSSTVAVLLVGLVLPAVEIAALGSAQAAAVLGPILINGPLVAVGLSSAAAQLFGTILMSLIVFLLAVAGGVALTALAARLAGTFVAVGQAYPLYGVHYAIASLGVWISNSTFYNIVFGDSSFIVHYLRLIGFDLSGLKQTGSNFGSHQIFDLPTTCRVGSGTMISDALTLISIRQSDTSFVVERVEIGADTFFGNRVVYIAGARTGDGNLFATKVLIPLHGPARERVGLLGSPPFEIPRTVVTKRSFDPFAETAERHQRLAAKNRHNLVTLVWYLILIWVSTLVSFGLAVGAYEGYRLFGWGGLVAWAIVAPAVSVAYFLAMERLGPGRMRLEPKTCTIHDLHYWRIERYWKMGETPLKLAFKGTPFRPWVYRMLGVNVGRMVYDDGCHITEKGLTEIGDHCCLNEISALQCHSLEDGLFKSDRIRLGAGCTLGVGAFVNYAVEMGDDATLEADAFLMKGSTAGAGEVWSGNPALRQRS